MSQAPQSHDHDSANQGPISTPQQLLAAVAAAFVIPVGIIVLLVNYVSSAHKDAAGSDALSPEAVSQRIMPVGAVELKLASANTGPRSGEEVYKAQCTTCHAAGTLGAPKFGDNGGWAARLGQGLATLTKHAVEGFNAMPPQGGGDFSEYEISRAVVYMANNSGGKLTEPPAPAGAASAADEGASAP